MPLVIVVHSPTPSWSLVSRTTSSPSRKFNAAIPSITAFPSGGVFHFTSSLCRAASSYCAMFCAASGYVSQYSSSFIPIAEA